MRIAQISTLASPVRKEGSHSIEQIVWLLTEELTKFGHDVTVFACGGSQTSGQLVETLPGPYGSDKSLGNWQTCELINLARAIERSGEFDVLHSHAYLWGVPLETFSKSPILHTLHVRPFADEARLWAMHPRACVTAISRHQWSEFPQLSPRAIIHHGVDPEQFTFCQNSGEYLCFLGRMIPEKGAAAAIAVARETQMRLRIAGPANDYFRREIEPRVDGREIEYVGEVSGSTRDQLLGGAKALLYPIAQPEPFGLVQIEAMMCGTPVVATCIGAVPEIIDEGVTGFAVASIDEFPMAVQRASALDRQAVRDRAVERFSSQRMAREYLAVYESIAKEPR